MAPVGRGPWPHAWLIPFSSIIWPRLNGNWTKASDADVRYNCIAWAAGDCDHWWEPSGLNGHYWPDGVPKDYTIESYQAAYENQGYEVCGSGELEPGFEKVALYANSTGFPLHAARQLPDGVWVSKLGKYIDITHTTPDDVGGGRYGEVVVFLRRRRP